MDCFILNFVRRMRHFEEIRTIGQTILSNYQLIMITLSSIDTDT